MDNLERYIRDNKSDFDCSVPPLGDSERFMAKLERSNAVRDRRKIGHWRSYAAAVVIFLLMIPASLYFFETNQSNRKTLQASNYMTSEQQEAQIYYVSSIKSGFSSLQKMLNNTNLPSADKAVLEEVMQNFEVRQKHILNDLDSSSGDERVVDALLDYYRVKLEVINGIVERLESLKAENNDKEQDFEL